MKEFCFIDNDFPDFRSGNLENKYMYTSKCNCDGSVQSGAAAVSHYCLSNIEYPNTECIYLLDIYLLYIHTDICVCVLASSRTCGYLFQFSQFTFKTKTKSPTGRDQHVGACPRAEAKAEVAEATTKTTATATGQPQTLHIGRAG